MHGVQDGCPGNFHYLPSTHIRIVFGPSAKVMACEVHLIPRLPGGCPVNTYLGCYRSGDVEEYVSKGARWNSLGQISPQDLPVPQRCIGLGSVSTGNVLRMECSRVLLIALKTVARGTSPR